MKHDILRGLLQSLVGGRTVVVAYAVGTETGRTYRIFGVGADEEEALNNLETIGQRKKLEQFIGKVQYRMYTPEIVERVMETIEQLRVTTIGFENF